MIQSEKRKNNKWRGEGESESIYSKKYWAKNCRIFTQHEGDYVSNQLSGKLKDLHDLLSVGLKELLTNTHLPNQKFTQFSP